MLIKMDWKSRFLNVCCVGLYFYFLQLTYREFVHPLYEYFGMGWYAPSAPLLALTWMLNLSAAFFMPVRYERPSQFFLVLQFLVIFVPATVVCFSSSLPVVESDRLVAMVAAMYVGLGVQLAGSYASARFSPPEMRGSTAPGTVLWLCGLASIAVLLPAFYVLKEIFQFSSLDSLNWQRDRIDKASLGAFLRYGLVWQAMVFFPILFASGLMLRGRRRWLAIGCCLVGYVLLFGLTATKTVLFAPAIIVGIFILLGDRKIPIVSFLSLCLTILICVPYLLGWVNLEPSQTLKYVNVVNFRTFAVPHLLYVQYLDFFSDHPLTYGSHVKLINSLVEYPYSEQVLKIIGEYYYPGSKMNANAGMWAQDGLAGFGVPGIVLISCVLSIVMMALDFAARGHDKRWVGTSLAMVILFLCNASLFTTILTGGLGLIIVILWVTKAIAWPGRTLT
jgi:hypothetical protein